MAGGAEEADFFADADYEAHDAADDASDEGGDAAGAFVEEFEEGDHDDEAEGYAQAEDAALEHADFRGALDGGEHGEGEEVAFFDVAGEAEHHGALHEAEGAVEDCEPEGCVEHVIHRGAEGYDEQAGPEHAVVVAGEASCDAHGAARVELRHDCAGGVVDHGGAYRSVSPGFAEVFECCIGHSVKGFCPFRRVGILFG